jgi:hypothetical protein
MIKAEISRYFNNITISESISERDFLNVIAGYVNNRNKSEYSKDIFSSFLTGETLWEYREKLPETVQFKKQFENINPHFYEAWKKGYYNQVKTNNLTIKFKDFALENYHEAIAHLTKAGYEVDEQDNFYSHATELIEKYSKINSPLVVDAIEHLKIIDANKKINIIKADQLIYKTADFRDFLFIGNIPRQTCLALNRSNSDCLLSMINQPNTIPFLIYAAKDKTEIPIGRCILRIEDRKMIIDDIYSAKVDFIDEICNFAQQLSLIPKLPQQMMNNISSHDVEYCKKNGIIFDYMQGSTAGLYYSDSLGGRMNEPKQQSLNPNPPWLIELPSGSRFVA